MPVGGIGGVKMEEFTAIKPRGNMILAEEVVGPKTTEAGLELPEGYDDGPQRWRVISVGPGNRNKDGDGHIPIGLKPGDIVGLGATKVILIRFNGRSLALLNADYVVCEFDEEQISQQIRVVK